jgi:hypothetical protein
VAVVHHGRTSAAVRCSASCVLFPNWCGPANRHSSVSSRSCPLVVDVHCRLGRRRVSQSSHHLVQQPAILDGSMDRRSVRAHKKTDLSGRTALAGDFADTTAKYRKAEFEAASLSFSDHDINRTWTKDELATVSERQLTLLAFLRAIRNLAFSGFRHSSCGLWFHSSAGSVKSQVGLSSRSSP